MADADLLREELPQYRRWLRDLAALSALPSVWVGYDGRRVIESLADVLLEMLSLDALCACLETAGQGGTAEVLRVPAEGPLDAKEARALLAPWLAASGPSGDLRAVTKVGGPQGLTVARLPFGPAAELGFLLVCCARPDFPSEPEWLILRVATNQAALVLQGELRAKEREASARREQHRAEQLQRLAEASLVLNSAFSLSAVLSAIAELAREIIGAHQAVLSLTQNHDWAQAIKAVSLSDKYAAWRSDNVPSDGSGIYALVCQESRPMRLSQAELLVHPAWRGIGEEAGRHPPLAGRLAAPLVARDRSNLGLIQLSDRYEGEFTPDDEHILVQLAQMSSVAIENARLYEELRNADRHKDEFLALLAQELRIPVATISNAVLVARTSEKEDRLAWPRDVIERQTRHMSRLIDDLLDGSRITLGKVQLQRERVELGPFLAHMVETVKPLVDARRHRLSVSVAAGPLWLLADATRLEQIVGNLLSNAVKHTREGGEISLAAERQGKEIVIQVRDNGAGIAPEMLPNLFDLFTQATRTLDRTEGGLSIGLTLVRKLAELHGGSVSAASDGLGRGSEFTVRLPADGEADAQHLPVPGPQVPAARSLRVLVVEANSDQAKATALSLQSAGHQVEIARNGTEALVVNRLFHPEAVLLDVGLPGIPGHQVARQLRAMEGLEKPLIIMMSGHGQAEDVGRSREAGADHHVVKPMHPDELLALLAERASAPAQVP